VFKERTDPFLLKTDLPAITISPGMLLPRDLSGRRSEIKRIDNIDETDAAGETKPWANNEYISTSGDKYPDKIQ